MTALWRDVRFGIRALVSAPVFAMVAIATLALGIGANSAIFSVVSGTLLFGLPWEDPSTIVGLNEHLVRQPDEERGVSTAKLVDWQEQARSFTALGAAAWANFNLTDRGRLESVGGARVTPDSFALLGIRPVLGRPLVPSDAADGAERVAVLSEGLWKRRYGADPAILGSTIELDGEPVVVVGVQPEAQWFPWPWTELIVPLALRGDEISRTDHLLAVWGRLNRGTSLEQAQAEMEGIAARLAAQYPESDQGWTARVTLTRDQLVQGPTRTAIWVMMAAVGLVLLIACANVANLLLARGAARRKEMGIRSALGASRAQLVVQLLTEGLVLALAALPLALLVSRWAISSFLSLVPPSVTYMSQFFRFDPPVWIFCGLVTIGTVLVFALGPALEASRVDLASALKEGGERGSSHAGRRRLRSALVVAQIGLALALLYSAGLMIQSFLRLQTADPGFDTRNLLVTSLQLPEKRYREPDQLRGFQRELLARIGRLPAVSGVATVNAAPFGFDGEAVDFEVRGRSLSAKAEVPRANFSNASADYLRLLGVPLQRGRFIEAADDENGRRVIVVNETLARRYFPAGDSLGERILYTRDASTAPVEHEIVGVVRDIKNWAFNEPAYPRIYAPYEQSPGPYLNLVVRTEGDPLVAAPAIRSEIGRLDPALATFAFESMDSRVTRSRWQGRMFSVVMVALGALALVLATVGVYGVVSYSTAQRTREFGIRSALGAEPSRIARLVLLEAALLAALGIAIGAFLAVLLAAALQGLLYEVSPWSPTTFLGVAALLAAVALLACALPARRATRADPMLALRAE